MCIGYQDEPPYELKGTVLPDYISLRVVRWIDLAFVVNCYTVFLYFWISAKIFSLLLVAHWDMYIVHCTVYTQYF